VPKRVMRGCRQVQVMYLACYQLIENSIGA
jgi:hypothetical protein